MSSGTIGGKKKEKGLREGEEYKRQREEERQVKT
jgi:hypothetical protein